MHQTHKFTSGEHEGTFMLKLGDLVIFAPVIGFIFQVELATNAIVNLAFILVFALNLSSF